MLLGLMKALSYDPDMRPSGSLHHSVMDTSAVKGINQSFWCYALRLVRTRGKRSMPSAQSVEHWRKNGLVCPVFARFVEHSQRPLTWMLMDALSRCYGAVETR